MSLVLADSSVWVNFFKTQNRASATLETLLREGLICTHGLIRAEVLSGARTDREFQRMAEGFQALDMVLDPPRMWERLAQARYRLARKGFQSSVADLIVALNALHHRKKLFTLDSDFFRIRSAIPFEVYHA